MRAVLRRGGALGGGAQRAMPGRGHALRGPRLGEGRCAWRAVPARRPRDERAASGRREGKQRSWGDEKRAGGIRVEEGCRGECGLEDKRLQWGCGDLSFGLFFCEYVILICG